MRGVRISSYKGGIKKPQNMRDKLQKNKSITVKQKTFRK